MKVTPGNRAFRGNQLMIGKVLAAADDAPLKQPRPAKHLDTEKLIAAQLKRQRRNANRATRASGAAP